MSRSYKIVPFRQSQTPLQDIQDILDAHPDHEYINHQYSDKLYPGKAGCFGIGAQPDTTQHIGFVVLQSN